VDGLLGDERRKTGWMRAEAAGDPGPWRQQAVLGRDRWDADALRDLVRDYATEHLADENAVLVVDETGFLKQGKACPRQGAPTIAARACSELPSPLPPGS
jgi:SRSO17 transposase